MVLWLKQKNKAKFLLCCQFEVEIVNHIYVYFRAPDSPKRAEKIDDLALLFIHVHHLINEFRPHQARETLRVMMQTQRRQRLETAERFQKHLEKVHFIMAIVTGWPRHRENREFGC